MVTIAHLTKKILQEKPFVDEALHKEIINIGALAEMIQPQIEKEIGKVKASAISMAIRRYVEKSSKEHYRKISLAKKTSLLVKSNLFEISVLKSHKLYEKLMALYRLVDFSKGDTLNIIQGNYEVLIIASAQYLPQFKQALKGESVQKTRSGISSLSMAIPAEFIDTPGFYFAITKALTLENISIIDIVNTETEATMILEDRDIARAYDVLQQEISVIFYKK